MRFDIRRRNIILYILGFLFIVFIVVFYYIFVHNSYKTVKFYYPDPRNNKLIQENRQIKVNLKNKESFEITLVREYMLGPMNYNLIFTLKDDIEIVNTWLISDKSIVINFNKEFSQSLKSNHDDSRLFFQGLVETLKSNTKLKKLYIMADNRNIKSSLGNWNLAYPIILLNDNKKAEKNKGTS